MSPYVCEKTMQELRDNLDVSLPILGVFACLDDHTNINKNVLHAIKSMFKEQVFQTVIPRNIAVEEAHNQGKVSAHNRMGWSSGTKSAT